MYKSYKTMKKEMNMGWTTLNLEASVPGYELLV